MAGPNTTGSTYSAPNPDEIVALDGIAVHQAVQSGDLSTVEVVEAQLAHLENTNPSINAITRVNPTALAEAAAVDALLRGDGSLERGGQLSLAGMVVTIKDNVDVAGQSTPNGLRHLDGASATIDSPMVENLRVAGAVVLGRTNTPEYSWRWHTDNPLFGATINPVNPELTPGGSSGGAAAALASRIGCLALGNDAGGSVRWPANCTGVTALRPTIGRVPSHNALAGVERPLGIDLMAVQGPMARTIADLRAMFSAMVSPSWRDPSYVPAPLERVYQKRAGLLVNQERQHHPEINQAMDEARLSLEQQGWTVKPIEAPDLGVAFRGWATLINTDFHQTNRAAMLESGSSAIEMMLATFDNLAPPADLGQIYELLAIRAGQLRGWQQLLTTEVDVIVMPVANERAWAAADDVSSPQRLETIFEANTPLVAINFLGLPSVAVPTRSSDRPLGVQVVAGRFAENVALDAAAAIERGSSEDVP